MNSVERLLGKVLVVALMAASGCRMLPIGESRDSVFSPDGRNEIRLYSSPLSYEVLRDGVTLVARTPIDLVVDGKGLDTGKAWDCVVWSETRNQKVATPVYKKAAVDLSDNSKFFNFGGKWGVDLVARNDGVAYRFTTNFGGKIKVTDEVADITIPRSDATCWVHFLTRSVSEQNSAQTLAADDLVNRMPKQLQRMYMPFSYTTGGKTVVATDSDVRDYPVWNFEGVSATEAGGQRLKHYFYQFPTNSVKRSRFVVVKKRGDYLVETEGARTFPWRTFSLADSPVKVVESDLVYALAAPAAKGTDFSWVKPGKVMWDWWNDWNLKGAGVDFKWGCNTKTYEYYIDFASKHGLEYVIFDEGWSEKLNIWKCHPNVDVPHLIEYAKKRNVGIILWLAWAQAYGDEAHVAEHFAKMGVVGFKVDFIDRSDADALRFMEKFAAECAQRKLLVDYHGCTHPTGLQRKYPNIINHEAIRGLEGMKFYSAKNPYIIENDLKCVFTRLTCGFMDYTPGAMDNYPVGEYQGDYGNPGSVGTRARQMAMMALYEAPLQMLCDTPAKYAKNPECFGFMSRVPTVWSDTVGLGGDPDSHVAVARKAYDGSWYVSGLNAFKPVNCAFDCKFLGAGKWTAEIFRDAPDCATKPTNYVREVKDVDAATKFDFGLAPAGGFVMKFTQK